jgi:hypothetical protein
MFRLWWFATVSNNYDVILYYTIPNVTGLADPLAACALHILYSSTCREIMLFHSLSVANSDCSITFVYRNHGYMHQLTCKLRAVPAPYY